MEACGPFWEELSEDEKDEYKRLAKHQHEYKRKRTSTTASEIEEKKAKLMNEQEEKRYLTEDLVYTANDMGELDDKIFYLLHITNYYDCYPAELGLAKFSLRMGIIDTLQIKINPGKLPCGTASMADDKAKETHKYLLPGLCEESDDTLGETSYILILLKIIDFLESEDELPIFFTEGSINNNYNELLSVQNSLIRIFEKGGEYDIATGLKICSVVDLFYCLNQVAETNSPDYEESRLAKFPSFVFAEEMFRRSEGLYRYSVPGCDYHEEIDNVQYCSLSKVICYGFVISKFCVNTLKYPLIEEKHFPKGFQIAEE